jgi:predicted nucleotidyltransferase
VYIIDSNRFKKALKARGYKSIGQLAKSLGIHRNTIHYYLSGNGVLPDNLEKMLHALDLKPADIIIEKREEPSLKLAPIALLIDRLHEEFPDVTIVLFGSRPRGTAHKYSDWDLGVFSKGGIPHELYRSMVIRKNELVEDLPFFVDLVNLNRADKSFLRESSRHWIFLAGKVSDWVELQRKVAA